MKTTIHARFISALDALILALAGALKLALLFALFAPASVQPRIPADSATTAQHTLQSAPHEAREHA